MKKRMGARHNTHSLAALAAVLAALVAAAATISAAAPTPTPAAHAEALLARGMEHYRAGRFADAEAALTAVGGIPGGGAPPHVARAARQNLGAALFKRGRVTRAAAVLRAAAAAAAADARGSTAGSGAGARNDAAAAWSNLCVVLHKTGRYAEAAAAAAAGLRVWPNGGGSFDAELHLCRGSALLDRAPFPPAGAGAAGAARAAEVAAAGAHLRAACAADDARSSPFGKAARSLARAHRYLSLRAVLATASTPPSPPPPPRPPRPPAAVAAEVAAAWAPRGGVPWRPRAVVLSVVNDGDEDGNEDGDARPARRWRATSAALRGLGLVPERFAATRPRDRAALARYCAPPLLLPGDVGGDEAGGDEAGGDAGGGQRARRRRLCAVAASHVRAWERLARDEVGDDRKDYLLVFESDAALDGSLRGRGARRRRRDRGERAALLGAPLARAWARMERDGGGRPPALVYLGHCAGDDRARPAPLAPFEDDDGPLCAAAFRAPGSAPLCLHAYLVHRALARAWLAAADDDDENDDASAGGGGGLPLRPVREAVDAAVRARLGAALAGGGAGLRALGLGGAFAVLPRAQCARLAFGAWPRRGSRAGAAADVAGGFGVGAFVQDLREARAPGAVDEEEVWA